ncbi:TOMM precursor leader peptide-binding protein [Halorussus caseinilyticus]|uniref:TOMM leader peptide-binding protein n=1 Tax=Halorussus caseinilyticus TaxID=3034025 RepID=A0ABD5WN74_9EURY|nr:TOMM precursor leader peptide-binding protein [Halorussus sp. DT72]
MSKQLVESLKEDHEYPEFNPSFVPVKVDDDTVHIRAGPWSGPIFTIRDVDEDESITHLVDVVDGQTHIEDVFAEFEEDQRGEVAKILEGLYDQDILHDREEHADDESWPHLSLKYTFHDQNRDRLESKSLLVVDCSGMGRQVAGDLLEMGLGEVRFHEPFDTDIDTRRLEEYDGFSRTDAEIESVIEDVDFAVYTADDPHPSLLDAVNRAAYETDTPWIPAQIHGFDAMIGPAVYPDETACYECFTERTLSNIQNIEGYQAYRRGIDQNESLSTMTLPSVERMVAGYLALDLTHLLAYGTGYTAGRVFTINTLELEMESNDVLKMPRCDVCGKSRGTDYQRYVTMDDVVEASDRMKDGGA